MKHSKQLGFKSVSIISNGSTSSSWRPWFEKYAAYLDILGVSIDSVDSKINFDTGRWPRGVANYSNKYGDKYLEKMKIASDLAKEFGVKLKINTVVTERNKMDDLTPLVNSLQPMRWKIFQVLPLDGENINCGKPKTDSSRGSKVTHDVTPFLISKHDYDEYIQRAKSRLNDPSILIAEDNNVMRSSYIVIDEFGSFLDSSQGGKMPTQSILDVGVDRAVEQLFQNGGFDRSSFYKRDGYYPDKWAKINKIKEQL